MKDYRKVPRGKGKSTRLVYISEYTGKPILVADKQRVSFIEDLARKLYAEIPEPISVSDLMNRPGIRASEVLIDDSTDVLISVFKVLGVKVDAIS